MSALVLRIIACVCMLLDHIGYCFAGRYPFLEPLRWIGRLAFPLYVFLIVNGFKHTSNRPRYALRLLIFAVVSQVPFALLFFKKEFLSILHSFSDITFLLRSGGKAELGVLNSFGTLNVFVTLLLALLVVWATDAMRKNRFLKYLCFLPTLAMYCVYYFGLIKSDYGAKGILLAMTFYLFDRERFTTTDGRITSFFLTLLGMLVSIYHQALLSIGFLLLNTLRGRPYSTVQLSAWQMTQFFALPAIVPIFLYNGKKGRLPASRGGAKAIQLGFYLFYPVHLFALFGLKLLLQ